MVEHEAGTKLVNPEDAEYVVEGEVTGACQVIMPSGTLMMVSTPSTVQVMVWLPRPRLTGPVKVWSTCTRRVMGQSDRSIKLLKELTVCGCSNDSQARAYLNSRQQPMVYKAAQCAAHLSGTIG